MEVERLEGRAQLVRQEVERVAELRALRVKGLGTH